MVMRAIFLLNPRSGRKTYNWECEVHSHESRLRQWMTFVHVLPSFVLTHSKHHRNVDEERIVSNLLFCLGRSFRESVSDVTFLFCFG